MNDETGKTDRGAGRRRSCHRHDRPALVCGLRVLVLEAEHPAAIRRQVSLCEAVYEGETTPWRACGPCG